MKLIKLSIASVFIFTTAIANNNTPSREVETVPSVNLEKYLGTWHEIATIPQFFQRKCVGNVTALYEMESEDTVKVTNSCDKEDGSRKTSVGQAKLEDKKTNAKLKVTFAKFFTWIYSFGGDYWIIDLADDYRYAVVGHPSRKYAWILSRSPAMMEEDLLQVSRNLLRQGYDLCKLRTTKQRGGFDIQVPLCEHLKGKL